MSRDSNLVSFSDFFKVLSNPHAGYKQNQYLEHGKLPIIDQGSSLVGGYTNEIQRQITVAEPLIVFGDHTRCVKYIPFNFALGADGVKVLQPYSSIDSKFAYYQLLATPLRNRGYARHMGELRKAVFWLPPLEKQRQIVGFLDAQISSLEKALGELKSALIKSNHLFLAALDEALEEVGQHYYKPLSKCLQVLEANRLVQRGWSPQCLKHPQSSATSWAVLKTTAVQNMRYEPHHNKELPKTLKPKLHLEVMSGDFLMTTTGPRNRCGVVCYVETTPERLMFSGKILRFRPDSNQIEPEWLELVLASHKYKKQLNSLKVGSSDSSVSIGNAQVLDLLIPAPSLAEQNRLIAKIRQIKELSEHFELEISHETQKFQQLRKALLSSVFAISPESE